MDIRQYLSVLRRQWLLVGMTIVVVVGTTLTLFALRPAQYRATAVVLLRPIDPSERFLESSGQTPEVNVRAEAAFAASQSVATEASKALPGADPSALRRQVTVAPDETTGLVSIHVTDGNPERARDIATAIAKAFVTNRVQATGVRRQELADRLGTRLEELAGTINDLTVRIGDKGLATGPLNALAVGGPPGSLHAQRYAAALQYQQIFERQQQLLIEQGIDQSGVELVTEAATPRDPIGPSVAQSCIVALFVGALVGFGLALLRNYLLDRVLTRYDVENAGQTVLAELPRDRRLRRNLGQVLSFSEPLSPLADGIRALRVRLQSVDSKRRLRTIVVTSANPGEGKSVVAANLATSYAQAGYQTVLVSDLRRPAFGEAFGARQAGRNLASLLAPTALPGAADAGGSSSAFRAADALVPTQVPNLRFLAAGKVEGSPVDLLGSSRLGGVLAELAAVVDVVILDSPAVLEATDALVLAAHADGAVLVSAVGETRRTALAAAAASLSGSGVLLLGVVLNKVKRVEARSGGFQPRQHGRSHTTALAPASRAKVPAGRTSEQVAGLPRRSAVGD